MTLEQIRNALFGAEYDFLRNDAHLGENICLLTLGGSHAYGTQTPDSDLDIRGCAVNSAAEILTQHDFEQVVDVPTDTTVYSFNKLIKLLLSANPNTIEILGCKPEHYLHVSRAGRLLLDNRRIFLSQRAAHAFGGYANQQLRRLENKTVREASQQQNELHILRTIEHAMSQLKQHYADFDGGMLKIYADKSTREEYSTEMFMDVTLKHYPLRDYASLWADMQSIVRSYESVGKRNANALSHGKINKHMMHLVRLHYMCFDILERGEIVTCREKEHDLLMSIRRGDFLDESGAPTAEFYELVDELERRMEYAAANTSLPEQPDFAAAEELLAQVNRSAITGQ